MVGAGERLRQHEVSDAEESLAKHHYDEEIGTDDFVAEIDDPGNGDSVLAGSYAGAGGTIDAYIKLDAPTGRLLQQVLVTGDFFVTPPRLILDLEAYLKGVAADDADAAIDRFFAENRIDTLSVAPGDFKASIANALAERASNG